MSPDAIRIIRIADGCPAFALNDQVLLILLADVGFGADPDGVGVLRMVAAGIRDGHCFVQLRPLRQELEARRRLSRRHHRLR